ncbi:hypothetical protein MJO28_017472 [Puccinia striiformis f. sp. tritici]|nr:hypothetical protein MJO28_017472 [Puccinia striiformis f. sp. tritici]KAI7956146.1 hypothetical protein MJO29_007545 [Puccinia striiformis f. sp. tritici]
MKYSIVFFLLGLTSSYCQAISSCVDSHFDNLLARREGPHSSTRLIARKNDRNLQNFAESLGGVSAPNVTKQGDIYKFGPASEKFKDLKSALNRSCDQHSNQCADNYNKKGQGKTAECNAQLDCCKKSVKKELSGNGGANTTGREGGGSGGGAGPEGNLQKVGLVHGVDHFCIGSEGGGSGGGAGGGAGPEGNLQKLGLFTAVFGGVAAPAITNQGDVLKVESGASDEQFKNMKQALTVSCDQQSKLCADKFKEGGDKTQDCNEQLCSCKDSAGKQ